MAVFELILCIIAAVVVSSFASRFVPRVSTPLVQIVLGVLVTYLPFFPDTSWKTWLLSDMEKYAGNVFAKGYRAGRKAFGNAGTGR